MCKKPLALLVKLELNEHLQSLSCISSLDGDAPCVITAHRDTNSCEGQKSGAFED